MKFLLIGIWGTLTQYIKKEIKECGNYRGVTMTCCSGRLYSRILKNRIEQSAMDVEELSRFCTGRSCSDIFTIRRITEKQLARNLSTHYIFVDLEKAYNSIPLSKPFGVFKKSGLNSKYIKSVFYLRKDAFSLVKLGKDISGKIEITKGLKHGWRMSPPLFNTYSRSPARLG